MNCPFCFGIPKIELHAHLGGSIRNTTLRELLIANGYLNAEELAQKCIIRGIDTKRTPSEQFEIFEIIGKVWKSEEVTKRITREFIEDCVKDNVVYAELRTSGSSLEKIVNILDAIDQGTGATTVRVIVSVKREWSISEAQEALKIASQLRERGVVGLDFCGNATCGDFTPFREIFLNRGLPVTCHFAETQGEKDLADILSINPSRIGHACYMDPSAEEHVRAHKIPIEVCFASNINTMKLFRGIVDHPFVGWWKTGHPVVPATDNYGILQCPLSEHFHMIHELGATEEQLWEIAEKSIEYIFAGEDVKEKLRQIFRGHELNPRNKH